MRMLLVMLEVKKFMVVMTLLLNSILVKEDVRFDERFIVRRCFLLYFSCVAPVRKSRRTYLRVVNKKLSVVNVDVKGTEEDHEGNIL